VVKGVKILPPTMADSIFSEIVKSAIEDGTVSQVIAAVKLTKREKDVMHLLSAERAREISRKLKMAAFTVNGHIRKIMDKLALHTRLEMAAVAQDR
jgi:DNA-binding CsgD family transcriptional regulator